MQTYERTHLEWRVHRSKCRKDRKYPPNHLKKEKQNKGCISVIRCMCAYSRKVQTCQAKYFAFALQQRVLGIAVQLTCSKAVCLEKLQRSVDLPAPAAFVRIRQFLNLNKKIWSLYICHLNLNLFSRHVMYFGTKTHCTAPNVGKATQWTIAVRIECVILPTWKESNLNRISCILLYRYIEWGKLQNSRQCNAPTDLFCSKERGKETKTSFFFFIFSFLRCCSSRIGTCTHCHVPAVELPSLRKQYNQRSGPKGQCTSLPRGGTFPWGVAYQ